MIKDPGLKVYAALFFASAQKAQLDENGRPDLSSCKPQRELFDKAAAQLAQAAPVMSADLLQKCHSTFLSERREHRLRGALQNAEIAIAEALWQKGLEKEARKIAKPLMKKARSDSIRKRAVDLVENGRVLFRPHALSPDGFRLLSMLPDGKRLMAVTLEGEIRTLDCKTGKVTFSKKLEAPADSLATSPNGTVWAASCNRGKVLVFAVKNPKAAPTVLTKHSKKVSALAFSNDGKLLASASLDASICVWDVATRKVKHEIKMKRGIRTVVFSPDGKQIAAAALDRSIYVWELGQADPVHVLKGHMFNVRCLAISKDGKMLVSGSDDMTIRVWELGKTDTVQTLKGHGSFITAVHFITKGKQLLSSSFDGSLHTWDLATGKETSRAELNDEGIAAMVLAPDGKTVYAAGRTSGIFTMLLTALKAN